LNESQAYNFDITSVDDVTLIYKDTNTLNSTSQEDQKVWKELIVNADLTNYLVEIGEVGITRDIYEKNGLKE
jgi:hypothetical protein